MTNTPQEIDTALADLYYERQKLDAEVARFQHTIIDAAGANYYYRGRKRVTDMTFEKAQAIVMPILDKQNDDDAYGYSRPFPGNAGLESVRRAVKELLELATKICENKVAVKVLQDKYTGWSRFFLVTSSQGHVHNSMHCSTCRWTTTYGWLPELSGQAEEDAVKKLGPALCSVCFPSAPLDWQGQKLSKKQSEDILAGKEIKAEPKKVYCPGSDQRAQGINWRVMSPYGRCVHCLKVVVVTQSGKPRKHKEQS